MNVLLIPGPAIVGDLDKIAGAVRAAGITVRIGTPDDLGISEIGNFEVIAGPGSLRCDAALMDRCPRLRALVAIGIGCEGFDLAAAAEREIAIATGATQENVDAMASATIMLMLALCHDLPAAQRACARGERRSVARTRTLNEAVVGLIGYGPIGREVARRLRAWNVTVKVYSPSLRQGIQDNGVEALDLEALLAASDVISLHAALTPISWHLLNTETLALMKPGAVIINTARGGLIDEDALVAMLRKNGAAAAALDCFEKEPLSLGSPLHDLPNVILTPHQVGHTATGAASVVRAFTDNIIRLAKLPR